MLKRSIQFITDSHPGLPALDTSISRVILDKVSQESMPETLRIYTPPEVVAFGPLDTISLGYQASVLEARRKGFDAIRRLAGGRAAVFHRGTIAFSWTIPDADPRTNVDSRFNDASIILLSALRQLGVEARIGQVPGEYCPGRFSINARGKKKIMGVGQRLVSRATHLGGVIVLANSDRIRDVLTPVYRALELNWDPDTVGSIEDELGSTTYEEAQDAITEAFEVFFKLKPTRLAGNVIEEAQLIQHQFIIIPNTIN